MKASPKRTSRIALAIVLASWLVVPVGAAERQRRTKPGADTPRTAPSDTKAGAEDPDAPLVSLVADRAELQVGETLFVTVRIANAADVGHVPFEVRFDPEVLRFARASEGSFLKADRRDTAFLAAPSSGGNAVVVGSSRLGPGGGATGEGELCVLEFTAIGTGETRLAFERASVRDARNRVVRSAFRPTRIRVY